MNITPVNLLISLCLFIWIYTSYHVTIEQIEKNGEFNLKVLLIGILIPPSLLIIACLGLLMLCLYADTGSSAIENLLSGKELDFAQLAWTIENL